MREPTATGGGVRHSTESMFTYHSGALVGSPAKAATSATGRRITVSVSTSTSPATATTSRRASSRATGRRATAGQSLLPRGLGRSTGLMFWFRWNRLPGS